MTNKEIRNFQKQDRLEQIRRVVKRKIELEGYTIEDFQREFYTSEEDLEDFRKVEAEVKGNM